MHELSIAESIVRAVLERTEGQHVVAVQVRIGALAAVVPDSLLFCFDLAAQGTPLQGARLEISEQPVRCFCHGCGQTFTADDPFQLCSCGSGDVELLSGRELEVASVEVT